jgi:hypothetical protein
MGERDAVPGFRRGRIVKKDTKKDVSYEEGLFKADELKGSVLLTVERAKTERAGARPQGKSGPAVDLLISQAKAPVREVFLFEEPPSDRPGRSEYRFNFCGGTVR